MSLMIEVMIQMIFFLLTNNVNILIEFLCGVGNRFLIMVRQMLEGK